MNTAEGIVAQPTALDIARQRLRWAEAPMNAGYFQLEQTHILIGILAALIALAESAGEIGSTLEYIANAQDRRADRRP